MSTCWHLKQNKILVDVVKKTIQVSIWFQSLNVNRLWNNFTFHLKCFLISSTKTMFWWLHNRSRWSGRKVNLSQTFVFVDIIWSYEESILKFEIVIPFEWRRTRVKSQYLFFKLETFSKRIQMAETREIWVQIFV